MSQVKKLASQTAVYGLSSIAGRFLNYLLVPLLTRVFTTSEFGVNVEFYSYISFFNILLTHGMETAFFRFAEKENNYRVYSNALISVLGVSSVFVVLFLFAGNAVSEAIGYGNHPEYLWFAVSILFFDSVSAIPFALLRQQNKALKFAVIRNANILINVVITLYFLLLCPYWYKTHFALLPFFNGQVNINHVFIANLVASFVTTLLLASELRFIRQGFDRELWKKMIAYAMPMLVVGFAGMINETLDRVLLRYVWPDKHEAIAMNGIYGANYKLSILITLFIQAFKYAAEPFFFSHAKTSNKREIYADVMNYFVLIVLLMFLMVTLFIHLFKDFIGKQFHEGLKVVPILMMANIFLGVYYNLSIWYKLSDQTGKGAVISLTGAGITIVLNLLLIPHYGYMGCAYTTLVCYFIMMILSYAQGQKYYPIPYQPLKLTGYILLALLLYAAGLCIDQWVEPISAAGAVIKLGLMLVFVLAGYVGERKSLTLFTR